MPEIKKEVVLRTTARLGDGERVEYRTAKRSTFVVVRVVLEVQAGSEAWAFTAYGYRKESNDLMLGALDRREARYTSTLRGGAMPQELLPLFMQMRDA